MDLIIFIIGGLLLVASLIALIVFVFTKKPKKKVVIGMGIGLVLMITGLSMGGTEPVNDITPDTGNDTKVEKPVEKPVEKEIEEPTGKVVEEEPESKETSVDTEKPDITWDDVKDQENIVGKSNKDYLDVTDSKPSEVRNDTTGKWKKNTIAKNINIEEYALSYKDLYMEEGDTHFVVNFNYNTTTTINYMAGLLYVDVKEYQSKEEHDAKKLGGGMVLKSYIIYPDGDIEEVGE